MFDEAMAHALTFVGTELSTYYGAPAIKANGHPILGAGHEPGRFVLHIGLETKLMLMEADPEAFWQTPHYDGWPAVLVREGGDPERIRIMIGSAIDAALAKKPARPQKAG